MFSVHCYYKCYYYYYYLHGPDQVSEEEHEASVDYTVIQILQIIPFKKMHYNNIEMCTFTLKYRNFKASSMSICTEECR